MNDANSCTNVSDRMKFDSFVKIQFQVTIQHIMAAHDIGLICHNLSYHRLPMVSNEVSVCKVRNLIFISANFMAYTQPGSYYSLFIVKTEVYAIGSVVLAKISYYTQ